MTNPTKLSEAVLPTGTVGSTQSLHSGGVQESTGPRRSLSRSPTRSKGPTFRVSRGEMIIGEWSLTEIEERIDTYELLPADTFYDSELSDWLPLSELLGRIAPVKVKSVAQPCYCGSGLPFPVCCGAARNY